MLLRSTTATLSRLEPRDFVVGLSALRGRKPVLSVRGAPAHNLLPPSLPRTLSTVSTFPPEPRGAWPELRTLALYGWFDVGAAGRAPSNHCWIKIGGNVTPGSDRVHVRDCVRARPLDIVERAACCRAVDDRRCDIDCRLAATLTRRASLVRPSILRLAKTASPPSEARQRLGSRRETGQPSVAIHD